MSPRDERRPPTPAVFALFSNGLLLLCAIALAAVVLWQNWPRRNPPNHVRLPFAARADSVAGKPALVLAKSVEQTPKTKSSPAAPEATTEHAKASAKSGGPNPKVSPAANRPTILSGDRSDEELATIGVFLAASPGVVHVATQTLEQGDFSLNVMEVPQGTGTGFVWDRDGHIVTNFHVIEGASGAQVAFGGSLDLASGLGRCGTRQRPCGAENRRPGGTPAPDSARDFRQPASRAAIVGHRQPVRIGSHAYERDHQRLRSRDHFPYGSSDQGSDSDGCSD